MQFLYYINFIIIIYIIVYGYCIEYCSFASTRLINKDGDQYKKYIKRTGVLYRPEFKEPVCIYVKRKLPIDSLEYYFENYSQENDTITDCTSNELVKSALGAMAKGNTNVAYIDGNKTRILRFNPLFTLTTEQKMIQYFKRGYPYKFNIISGEPTYVSTEEITERLLDCETTKYPDVKADVFLSINLNFSIHDVYTGYNLIGLDFCKTTSTSYNSYQRVCYKFDTICTLPYLPTKAHLISEIFEYLSYYKNIFKDKRIIVKLEYDPVGQFAYHNGQIVERKAVFLNYNITEDHDFLVYDYDHSLMVFGLPKWVLDFLNDAKTTSGNIKYLCHKIDDVTYKITTTEPSLLNDDITNEYLKKNNTTKLANTPTTQPNENTVGKKMNTSAVVVTSAYANTTDSELPDSTKQGFTGELFKTISDYFNKETVIQNNNTQTATINNSSDAKMIESLYNHIHKVHSFKVDPTEVSAITTFLYFLIGITSIMMIVLLVGVMMRYANRYNCLHRRLK